MLSVGLFNKLPFCLQSPVAAVGGIEDQMDTYFS